MPIEQIADIFETGREQVRDWLSEEVDCAMIEQTYQIAAQFAPDYMNELFAQ